MQVGRVDLYNLEKPSAIGSIDSLKFESYFFKWNLNKNKDWL